MKLAFLSADRRVSTCLLILSLGLGIPPADAQLNRERLAQYPELEGTIISDVLADKMNQLWIATQNGLVRFDGYEFQYYTPDAVDSTTLGTLLTNVLYEDTEGTIWIGCTYDQIYAYNPETRFFKPYTYTHLTDFVAQTDQSVSCIAADARGRIYFGIATNTGRIGEHALVYYNPSDDQLRTFEYPDSMVIENVYRMSSDPQGNIWLAAENGYFKINPDQELTRIDLKNILGLAMREGIMEFDFDPEGVLWALTKDSRLIAYHTQSGKLQSWQVPGLMRDSRLSDVWTDLLTDGGDTVWIGGENGLTYLDKRASVVAGFSTSSPQTVRVNGMCRDGFGNIWIASRESGLLRYSTRSVFKSRVYDSQSPHSLTSGWIYRIFAGADGRIYMASQDGSSYAGINVFDPETKAVEAIPYPRIGSDLNVWNVSGMYPDGKILVTDDHGKVLIDPSTWTYERLDVPRILDSLGSTTIYQDRHGRYWMGTFRGAVTWIGDISDLAYIDTRKLPGSTRLSGEVMHFAESRRHGMWLETNDGLFAYDPQSGQLTRHGKDPMAGDTLPFQDINAVYEDNNGIVWVGTWEHGFCRYDPEAKTIRTYTETDGLTDLCIQGILPDDKHGALWLSSFRGIIRFSIADEIFTTFTIKDGIQGMLYADGSAIATSNGLLVFGGNNGFTYFDPDDFAVTSQPPQLMITDFRITNTSLTDEEITAFKNGIQHGESIALAYDQNDLVIDYVGIQYDDPQHNQFSYQLENYDPVWRDVGNQRTAYYYNLPPGEYTFRVKAANSSGVWTPTAQQLHFTIAPPWWRTRWAYMAYGILIALLGYVINRHQKARVLRKERDRMQKKELAQAREIEKAYAELKATQAQLLHSEKMASLGEMTAGIAHEIQNPLNFINNFSEINKELLEELQEAIRANDISEAATLSQNVIDNETKITFHGKRADAIVKSMLQHSRGSSGQKDHTDINTLCDEYLRLAYHGLRARDKSFNVEFKTHLDPTLPKIDVVPQDIGRVLLNLINNAFQACNDKRTTQHDDQYKPEVTVTTQHAGNQIIIGVRDNGDGIPEDLVEKIFEPFFTTKAAGQGTGLGLSMSYDIIRAHGGSIKAESKQGVGATFIVRLPVNAS